MLRKFAELQVLAVHAGSSRRGRVASRKHGHLAHFEYTPREGFIYVRSRAISSRMNLNYDLFPAEELRKSYRTFIGKPVFVNHHNSDHRRARGVVLDAALHEDNNPDGTEDAWVEVLMEVDARRFPRLAEALLNGDIERTSMGVDVKRSQCLACGNWATTPGEYCDHVRHRKGQRYRRADGTEVVIGELCEGLSFFENSLLVEDPADPTAHLTGIDASGVGGGYRGSLKVASRWTARVDPRIISSNRRTAMRLRRAKTADRVRVPKQVDTLTDSDCPVCGEEDSIVDGECRNCGYSVDQKTQGPDSLSDDPDTSKARQFDQAQDGESIDDIDEGADPDAATANPEDVELLTETLEVLDEVRRTLAPGNGEEQLREELRTTLEQVRELVDGGAAVPSQGPPEELTDEEDPDDEGEEDEEPDEEAPKSEDEDGSKSKPKSKSDDDKPPWLKKKKSRRGSLPVRPRTLTAQGVREESIMRMALSALREAHQRIEAQDKRIATLERQLAFVGEVAGIGDRLAKLAADDAVPGPEQTPESTAPPSESTDQAATPQGTDDPTSVGASPVTDVSPDATGDVTEPGGVVEPPAPDQTTTPTAPVAGTTERPPLEDVRDEGDPVVGTPADEAPADPPVFPATTTESLASASPSQPRTIAALRLARLRIEAGIAEVSDDLVLGERIATDSEVTDEHIAREIATLSAVVGSRKTAKAPPPRHLVPKVAGGGSGGGRSEGVLIPAGAPTASAPSNADEAFLY